MGQAACPPRLGHPLPRFPVLHLAGGVQQVQRFPRSVLRQGAAMPDSFQTPCPLCNLPCTAFLEDYGKWMHFSCRCCRELKVSKMVIGKLRAESNDVREQLSQQARALVEGEYLHIAAADQGSLQPRGLSAWIEEVRRSL